MTSVANVVGGNCQFKLRPESDNPAQLHTTARLRDFFVDFNGLGKKIKLKILFIEKWTANPFNFCLFIDVDLDDSLLASTSAVLECEPTAGTSSEVGI